MPLSFSNRIVPNVSLTFDDVLLVPAASTIVPNKIDLRTRLSRNIELNIPLLSAGMEKITEEKMAILMAQLGGLGVIHRTLSPSKQAERVRKVKKYQARIIRNVMTVFPETSLAEVADMQQRYGISLIPVIDSTSKALIGMITEEHVKNAEDFSIEVGNVMTKEDILTLSSKTDIAEAVPLMKEKNAKYVTIIDDERRVTGMITASDIEKAHKYPQAAVDEHGCLRVAAAVGVGEEHFDRVSALIDAGVDVIVVDEQHGHHKDVTDMVTFIRRQRSGHVDVIAGNIATSDGALTLIDAGADAVKVGVGVGSSSMPRVIAGVGVPPLTALMDVAEACMMREIPVIAGSGIRSSADLAKALASGASSAMLGTLLMGTLETPHTPKDGETPENTEKRITGLLDGLRLAMNYTGCQTLKEFRTQTRFIRIDDNRRSD